ncbi:Cysteine protease atg4b [Mortierella polycephala]|uniref:Autophagy-related protein 4 n=1 Tax=Mortierella polycephala TaxID=41804 RepID=A0A9P6PQ29_9FUNG|nr:Cysteine protease atg4b [Mortierella polycephala]
MDSFQPLRSHQPPPSAPLPHDTRSTFNENGTGAIYAEVTYGFVPEIEHPRTTVNGSMHASARIGGNINGNINSNIIEPTISHNSQSTLEVQSVALKQPYSTAVQSPTEGYDLVEPVSPTTANYFARQKRAPQNQQQDQDGRQQKYQHEGLQLGQRALAAEDGENREEQSRHIHLTKPLLPNDQHVSASNTLMSIPTLVRSHLEEDSGDDEDDTEELFFESYTEEPDAGEHFMQATSEFFSKMGYWLYNSRVGQYIARDEKSRTKSVFQAEDIWILGACYSFEPSESSITLPVASRSRKSSVLQGQAVATNNYAVDMKTGTLNIQGSGLDSLRDAVRGQDRPRPHTISSARSMTDSEVISVYSTTTTALVPESDQRRSKSKERSRDKQLEKELAKAKKIAKAKERESEKEQEKAKAKEKMKQKELEKLQKFKAKISNPIFDKNNVREGLKDLHTVATMDPKEHNYLQIQRGFDQKPHSIHGYQPGEQPYVGLGLMTESSESPPSVIRKTRPTSILHKVPSAADFLTLKKSSQEWGSRALTNKSHHLRSQSITNLSIFSQRSTGATSHISHEDSSNARSTSSPPPYSSSIKDTMNVYEALAVGPKPSVLSRLSLNQKKLPQAPNLDDLPDIPMYYHGNEEPNAVGGIADQTIPSTPPPLAKNTGEDSPSSITSSPRNGWRRMTISGIFPKESKPESGSNTTSLKALMSATKSTSKQKEESPAPKHQPPTSWGPSTQKISFSNQGSKDGPLVAVKSGAKTVQNWLDRRRSNNNLNQQFFVASTDEPVPMVSKDLILSPPGSPLSQGADVLYGRPQTAERHPEQASQQQRHVRTRKKSSLFSLASSASITSSPKSVLKSSSPHSPSMDTIPSLPFSQARLFGNQPAEADNTHIGPVLSSSQADSIVVLEPPLVIPSNTNTNDTSSFSDLVILPPLPPESPSETFVLLDQRKIQSVVPMEHSPEDPVMVSMVNTEPDTLGDMSPIYDTRGVMREANSLGMSRHLVDQRILSSNEKDKGLSDLRSDWEALRPSKQTRPTVKEDASGFVHIRGSRTKKSSTIAMDGLSPEERERIRKIGSAYIKVKDPFVGIAAPQPKIPVMPHGLTFDQDTTAGVQRTASPEPIAAQSFAEERPSSAKSRLLNLPSALVTAPPKQSSPSSPSAALGRSLRAISPRSQSPRHTLPVVSSSASASSCSITAQPFSMEPEQVSVRNEDMTRIEDEVRSRKKDGAAADPALHIKHLLPETCGQSSRHSSNQAALQRFMHDFQSKLWFTYRKDMARIEPSYYTSDAGWGCMMRTGQSLLAHAFVQIMLGRDWRIQSSVAERDAQKYRTLLSWFADEPERYYSIHNIAKSGLALDKRVGEWFGPSTVAHALRRLSQRHVDCPLAVMVPMDNSIRMSEIVHAATTQQAIAGGDSSTPNKQEFTDTPGWKPVVMLIPARYGLDKLTERYTKNLKQLFRLPQFLGIAGGRPGRSLYFVASQGNELLYFDPHFVKPRATQEELALCPSMSYHCNVVRAMDIQELDPSMMLGFLIQSPQDLLNLSELLKRDMEKAYPLVTIVEDVSIPVAVTHPSDQTHCISTAKSPDKSLASDIAPSNMDTETNTGSQLGPPTVVQNQTVTCDVNDRRPEKCMADRSLRGELHGRDVPPVSKSRRDMKRITMTLRKEKVATDKDTMAQRGNGPYQYRNMTHDGDYSRDPDTASVKSFHSDHSL